VTALGDAVIASAVGALVLGVPVAVESMVAVARERRRQRRLAAWGHRPHEGCRCRVPASASP
jgi:hypothetical protein